MRPDELAPVTAAGHEPPPSDPGTGRHTPRVRGAPDPRRKAMELLNRREHSRAELQRKLTARGFDPDQVEAVLDEMAGRGWQDDARFAQALARHRVQSGYGPVRIRAELRTHAIDEASIEAALAACGADWQELAIAQLQRRYGSRACTDDLRERGRRSAYLQRRGFPAEQVRRALEPDSP